MQIETRTEIDPTETRTPDLWTTNDSAITPVPPATAAAVEQLEQAQVYLVGARLAGRLAGVAGIELQADATGELKRFYVQPDCRRRGVAGALIGALLNYAARHDVSVVRLETGDKQKAAIAFYRRHGFVEVPRFAPYLDSATSVCMQRAVASGGRIPDG